MRQTIIGENMNELEMLRAEYQECINRQIRLKTLKEQALLKNKQIEDKYQITNEEQLRQLVDKLQQEYNEKIQEASLKLVEIKQSLSPYEGIMQ